MGKTRMSMLMYWVNSDDRFDVLMRRLAYLEDAIASKSAESSFNTTSSGSVKDGSPNALSSVQASSHEGEGETLSHISSRIEDKSPISQGHSHTTSHAPMMQDPQGSELCQSSHNPVLRQAEHYFRIELGTSELNINQERQHLFHSGLALAQQTGQYEEAADMLGVDPTDSVNFYSDSMYPSLEFLYVTLNGLGLDSSITQYYLQINSYLSRPTLEHMGIALVENTVHGQRRLEYIACVNFWIHLVLTSLESGHPTTLMAQHMGGTRDKYAENAKSALKRMSIMASPTITTLQALISGVMLFLHIGDFGSCWVLNAAACRACVALGYFTDGKAEMLSNLPTEVRNGMFHCFLFDRAFSANMNRPCSLPEMDLGAFVPPGDDQLGQDVYLILADIGQGLDVLIRERRKKNEKEIASERLQRLHKILEKLKSVDTRLGMVSLSPPHQSDSFLKGDWMAMEFTYYSIRAALLGLVLSTSFDTETYQARLVCARRALMALKSMQDNAWAHCTRSMAFAGSLTWTILIFPFLAFFVIFTNVVITADLTDLRLLKEVADGFTVISASSSTISRIEDFCKKLVKLCFDTITKSKQATNGTAPLFLQQPGSRESSSQNLDNLVQNVAEIQGQITHPVDQGTTVSPTMITTPSTGMRVEMESDKSMPDIEKMFSDDAEWFRLDGYEQQVWQFLESKMDGFGGVI